MLRKWFGGEPALVLLPNDRWVQAFFDGCPDREAGCKLVTVDCNVGAIPNTDFIDLIEQIILCITGKYVCHARLNPKANQREQSFLLPLRGFIKLIVTQLNSCFMEGIA